MKKSTRPKIKVKWDAIDWFLEGTGFVVLLLLFGLPAYFYKELPVTIPVHHGFYGTPDNFSRKGMIWILPVTGLVIYIGLAILNRFPHIFNYPVEITHENAREQYKKAGRMIRLLNTIVIVSFCYITYATIMTAKHNENGVGNFFIPVFIVLIFIVMGVYLYKFSRTKSEK
ncbi:MAG: DUF1648 domain-containing protein [Chlorobi bacterium]|nr:DUF1648 domain-containing protein [Chlorobiota bacterium]